MGANGVVVARLVAGLLVVVILGGCEPTAASPTAAATPVPSVAAPTPTTTPATASEPPPSPRPTPTVRPSATAQPSPPDPSPSVEPSPFPSPPTSMALPGRLGDQAWVTAVDSRNAEGDTLETTVAMGGLGQPASRTMTIPVKRGHALTMREGPYALVILVRDGRTRVDTYRAATGGRIDRVWIHGRIDPDRSAIDAGRRVLYATMLRAGGGLDIRRISLDGGASTTLVSLGRRFTPDAYPTDHMDAVVATDGHLVIEACADDRCRVWRIAPGAPAGAPLRLPRSTPELCSLIGATDRWLIAYDEELCSNDTGGPPFPIRRISLVDGSSRLISRAARVIARGVVVVGGRPLVIASRRSRDWSRTRIETIDVRTAQVAVRLEGLRNLDDQFHGVATQRLPGAWVLVEPWGVDASARALLPAALLNLRTGRVIVLLAGTFGWS